MSSLWYNPTALGLPLQTLEVCDYLRAADWYSTAYMAELQCVQPHIIATYVT